MQESRTITRKSASNLALAFVLLPKAKRDGMSALYAFCREVDDVADADFVPVEQRRAELARWRTDIARACGADLPPHTGGTAVESASGSAQIFSLSPRGRSGERAGERGSPMLTTNANRKQEGPPLPGPLLPPGEEREKISPVSSVNSTAMHTGGPRETPLFRVNQELQPFIVQH